MQGTGPVVPVVGEGQLFPGEDNGVSPLFQNKSQSIVNLSVIAPLFKRLPISSHPRNIGMWDLDPLCPKHRGKQTSFFFFLFSFLIYLFIFAG